MKFFAKKNYEVHAPELQHTPLLFKTCEMLSVKLYLKNRVVHGVVYPPFGAMKTKEYQLKLEY